LKCCTGTVHPSFEMKFICVVVVHMAVILFVRTRTPNSIFRAITSVQFRRGKERRKGPREEGLGKKLGTSQNILEPAFNNLYLTEL
jgi:hypothetical protein